MMEKEPKPMGSRLHLQPSADPFDCNELKEKYSLISQCTPVLLQQSIIRLHEKRNFLPSKKFCQT